MAARFRVLMVCMGNICFPYERAVRVRNSCGMR
jgi:hypothetical protein